MRSRILDSVEAISNLIALNSHLRELLSDEEKQKDELQLVYKLVLETRRKLQSQVEALIDKSDGHYHCAFKHAMAYYMYANELEDADKAFAWQSVEAEMILNSILSLMTWEKITLCSRCLADQILNKDKK